MQAVRKVLLVTVAIACVAMVSPAAAQAIRAGDHFPIRITAHGDSDVEATPTRDGKVFRLTHPGATFMAVHFDDIELMPGSMIRISDGKGGQSFDLRGRGKMEAGRFWSQHVKGDTIVIRLFTRGPQDGGFVIDQYNAGFVDLGTLDESICGTSDFRNAVCYQGSHPTEYDRGRAIARLLTVKPTGSFLCTGWLASADDHFVTNEHCITNATEALNTDYEFMAEAANCGDGNCQLCHPGTIISGGTFIQDSVGLDYSLTQLGGNPAATYGFLQIDDRNATIGEEVYMVSHPAGRAKEMGIESTHNDDLPSGVCHVVSVTEPTCSGAVLEVGYYCDTQGGSSGSPVLARSSHKVIALHHCRGNNFCPSNSGGDPNRGVPIDEICAEICSIIDTGGCAVDADCDDGDPCTQDVCTAGTCDNIPQANCCGNGICESGEDCDTCSSDCPSTSGGTPGQCGNDVCEPSFGEDCTSCSQDCNGKQNGKQSNRYCCGAGGGTNPIDCSDPRCTGAGNTCGDVSGGTCCGDLVCDPGEECSCELDCGAAPGSETSCTDGVDNDCDGDIDCADADCSGDPACAGCSLGQVGDSCAADAECCSNKCKGPPGGKTCK